MISVTCNQQEVVPLLATHLLVYCPSLPRTIKVGFVMRVEVMSEYACTYGTMYIFSQTLPCMHACKYE